MTTAAAGAALRAQAHEQLESLATFDGAAGAVGVVRAYVEALEAPGASATDSRPRLEEIDDFVALCRTEEVEPLMQDALDTIDELLAEGRRLQRERDEAVRAERDACEAVARHCERKWADEGQQLVADEIACLIRFRTTPEGARDAE